MGEIEFVPHWYRRLIRRRKRLSRVACTGVIAYFAMVVVLTAVGYCVC